LLTDLSAHEKRRLVRFNEIPQPLIHAVTSVEDKHFFEHGGFDYRRAMKAAYVDFKDGRKQQGASTLTMQLARALWLRPRKSWSRKADEILITLHLEHVLSKQQIFEDYANQIYLGRRGPYSINGFGEAARVYFGKELWQIDTAEAALLAGLVQRPSYYNPFRYPERAIARRNLVLALMKRNGELSEPDYRAAAAAPLKLAPQMTDDSENSYFLSMMNDELQSSLGESAGPSRTVVTTLDPQLQRAAESAVRSGMEAVDRQLHITGAPGTGRKRTAAAGRPDRARSAHRRNQGAGGGPQLWRQPIESRPRLAAAGLGVQTVRLRRRHRNRTRWRTQDFHARQPGERRGHHFLVRR
jgi:penicillin-binding protein 1B